MDTNKIRTQLVQREQELRDSLSGLQSDARASRVAEVEDEIDRVTSDEGKAGAFGVSSIEAENLTQVQAAIQRVDDGTYGTCLDCGKPIPEARLKAVPWAAYCVDDQEKHDAESAGKDKDQDIISPDVA